MSTTKKRKTVADKLRERAKELELENMQLHAALATMISIIDPEGEDVMFPASDLLIGCKVEQGMKDSNITLKVLRYE